MPLMHRGKTVLFVSALLTLMLAFLPGSIAPAPAPYDVGAGACTPGEQGIKVGTVCFDCGTSDGVCPEDFGADCSLNPDPDAPRATGIPAGNCGCVAETDPAFCARNGFVCGPVSGTDNCGAFRVNVACGACGGTDICNAGTGQCVPTCTPENNAAFCSRLAKNCGLVSDVDNCGTPRNNINCGSCTAPQTCGGGGTSNVCGCTDTETDAAFCARHGATCGIKNGQNYCQTGTKNVNCGAIFGPCGAGTSCSAATNTCVPDVAENNSIVCSNTINDDPSQDALVDYFDNVPGFAAGQSCNICTAAACQALNAANVPQRWTQNAMPVAVGTIFSNATAARPGDAANLRMDYDAYGPGSCWCAQCDTTNGYAWSGGACIQQPQNCGLITADAKAISFVGPVTTAPGETFTQLTYDILGATWNQPHYIEWYVGGTMYDNVTEAPNYGSNLISSSAFVSGLAAGSHTITARLYSICTTGTRTDSFVTTFVVNPPSPPALSPFVVTANVSDWQAANVTFSAGWNHPQPVRANLTFGDGTYYEQTFLVGGPQIISFPNNRHRYTLPVATSLGRTAILNVTDIADPSRSSQATVYFTIRSYGLTTGTPDGTPPLYNDPAACDLATGCAILNSTGKYECVSPTACFPDNQTRCFLPDDARDRDADATGDACQTNLGTSFGTCNAAVWTLDGDWSGPGANGNCCGDDVEFGGEFPSTAVFGIAGPTACCPSPNQCFSTANGGACVDNQIENTPALCADGLDNDCDGAVDAADPGCAGGVISGYVFVQDSQGTRLAKDAVITLGNKKFDGMQQTITQGNKPVNVWYYEITDAAVLTPGDHFLTASLFGYSTETRTITINVGVAQQQDFTLTERLCNDDCTNKDGFCDTSCIGVGACQPTAPEIRTMQACHPQGAPFGLRPGQEVIVTPVQGATQYPGQVEVGLCCKVAPQWRNAPKTTVSENPAFGKIDTLVKYTTTVIVNGKPYKFVVNTW